MMQEHWRPPATMRQAGLAPMRRFEGRAVPVRGGLASGRTVRAISRSRLAAIRAAMYRFVQDDVSRGLAPDERRYCDACECPRAAAGFVQYDRYLICNACATEYEIANARGLAVTAGQYVRDKNFGETGCYALDPEVEE